MSARRATSSGLHRSFLTWHWSTQDMTQALVGKAVPARSPRLSLWVRPTDCRYANTACRHGPNHFPSHARTLRPSCQGRLTYRTSGALQWHSPEVPCPIDLRTSTRSVSPTSTFHHVSLLDRAGSVERRVCLVVSIVFPSTHLQSTAPHPQPFAFASGPTSFFCPCSSSSSVIAGATSVRDLDHRRIDLESGAPPVGVLSDRLSFLLFLLLAAASSQPQDALHNRLIQTT